MTQGSTTATQTPTNFTGTLLQRKHELGEKFVQLVFRDHDHDVVCITSNLRAVALPVGQPYRVKGILTYRGKRAVLIDPQIADPKQRMRFVRRATVALLVFCLTSVGGMVLLQHDSAKASTATSNVQAASDVGRVQVSTY